MKCSLELMFVCKDEALESSANAKCKARGTVVRGICKEVFTLLDRESQLRKEVRIRVCVDAVSYTHLTLPTIRA